MNRFTCLALFGLLLSGCPSSEEPVTLPANEDGATHQVSASQTPAPAASASPGPSASAPAGGQAASGPRLSFDWKGSVSQESGDVKVTLERLALRPRSEEALKGEPDPQALGAPDPAGHYLAVVLSITVGGAPYREAPEQQSVSPGPFALEVGGHVLDFPAGLAGEVPDRPEAVYMMFAADAPAYSHEPLSAVFTFKRYDGEVLTFSFEDVPVTPGSGKPR